MNACSSWPRPAFCFSGGIGKGSLTFALGLLCIAALTRADSSVTLTAADLSSNAGLGPVTASPEVVSGSASQIGIEPQAEAELSETDPMDVLNRALTVDRLMAYHPNYGVLATDHGESRIQFQLSFEYELFRFPTEWWNQKWAYRPSGFYLAYDGLYDFYWASRPASPVISRDQNPGAFFRFVPRKKMRAYGMDLVEAGWFHESNGQTTVNETQYQQVEAELGANAAQDSVHRGWDYWYLGSEFTYFPFNDPEYGSTAKVTKTHFVFSFQPSLRLYDGKQGFNGSVSENVFWEPVSVQPYISNYDGIRGTFVWGMLIPDTTFLHLNSVAVSADLRTGYNYGYFASNWSKRFTLTVKTGYVPWYIYYDNGYGPYISDYTTWSQGWGVGIRVR